MVRILDDQEILELISEQKPLPTDWRRRMAPRRKSHYQYDERDISIQSTGNKEFRIIIRKNRINLLDFSIILMFEDFDHSYRLLRFNGIHLSRHTNHWEKEQGLANSRFDPNFHIHRATERYQMADFKIDGYAEITTLYTDYDTALTAFLVLCNFEEPESPQIRLFRS